MVNVAGDLSGIKILQFLRRTILQGNAWIYINGDVLGGGFPFGLQATTTIKNDTSGILIFRVKGYERLDKPVLFRTLQQDQAYFDVVTPTNFLMHIESDLVVKVVFFIDPLSFPTKFEPEDLAVLKAKIDELHTLDPISPEAAKLAASHLQFLQNIYDVESARYKQAADIAAQKFKSEQEKAEFDRKCELLRLDLQASAGDLKHSEDVVKEMEPLANRSELLTDLLAKWNQEKNRALQLSTESRQLWDTAAKTHPECFKPVDNLKSIPDFPPDLKEKIADLQTQMDQFRTNVSLPQTMLYCKNEVPALFVMNELPKLVEKIKAIQYQEAGDISQKVFHQVQPEQIVDPYTAPYNTFKNYSDLVADLRARFFRQVTKAQATEGEATDREVLVEYQKAYDLIPDPKIAEKIEELKTKIQTQ